MPDWTRATAEAEALAGTWSAGGGPGGAILLFDSGGIRGGASGGFASIEHALPFTAETPSRYASISKQFLAATLLLEDIPLEAPLGALLPGLPEALGTVPLGRALDMTAALPDTMELLWQQGVPFTASLKAGEILALVQRLPGLNAVPGSEMAYSNTGCRLAQGVFPAQRGVTYAEALRRRLLAPLDLPIAFPEDETEIVPGLATGYWREGASWRRGRYGIHFSASGGLAGSAAALARWAAALLAGRGPLAGMLERLAAPRFLADGTESLYRLGLVRSALGRVVLLGHGGSLPGYRNHVLMAPEQGLGVVVLTNREEDALWPALRVMAALVEEELPPPPRDLPSGLFATAEGPFWAETGAGAISYMGAHEQLVATPEGGWRSLPAYLDIRLRPEGAGTLAGHVGGAARRLLRVPPDQALDPRLPGEWREPRFGLRLTLRADGTARFPTAHFPWAGGLGAETRLTPLPSGRALADLAHGPWRHRPCLYLEPDGSLRVASHRARVLHFHRCNELGDVA